jgi:hypothetical protein
MAIKNKNYRISKQNHLTSSSRHVDSFLLVHDITSQTYLKIFNCEKINKTMILIIFLVLISNYGGLMKDLIQT